MYLVFLVKLLVSWLRYEKYHVCYGGDEEERKANYSDMVRAVLFSTIFNCKSNHSTKNEPAN